MKEIEVITSLVPAKGRSKNYQGLSRSVVSSVSSPFAGTSGSSDTAKVAQNLATDSTDWDKILLKSDFAEFFEKTNVGTTDTPAYAIHAKLPLFSEGGLTAYGKGSAGTGGSGSLDETLLWQILGNTSDEQIAVIISLQL